jgi:nucleotide-binding universal stress UspA family protein
MEIRRILCPTDFSEASAHAVDQAIAIAGYYKAAITALHVTPSIELSLGAVSLDTIRQEIAAFFKGASSAGTIVEAVAEIGAPAHQIVECARRLPADLIVLGTHGTSGFERLILGSVAETVLRHAICPVLTVPPRAQAQSQLPFCGILCAVDFSEPFRSAVGFATSLAKESGARLTLMHVLEWPWHEPPEPTLDELAPEQAFALALFRREAEERARGCFEPLVAAVPPGVHVNVRITSGTPSERILAAATEENADLIVIGVGGRNAVSLALLGSTANEVIRTSRCPVLTLRQPG